MRARRLELELLKKAIQPHFLFNTLTAVRGWLLEDPVRSLDPIDALGDEVRSMVELSDQILIPLDKEVVLCRTHLQVMGLRLDRVYGMDVVGATGAERVSPLVFHTMVENAFTHADPRTFSRFRLIRTAMAGSTRYTFSVDGRTPVDTPQREGTGMKYIRARLEESFPGRCSVRCARVEGVWVTTVEIREPEHDGQGAVRAGSACTAVRPNGALRNEARSPLAGQPEIGWHSRHVPTASGDSLPRTDDSLSFV